MSSALCIVSLLVMSTERWDFGKWRGVFVKRGNLPHTMWASFLDRFIFDTAKPIGSYSESFASDTWFRMERSVSGWVLLGLGLLC